MEIKLLLIYKQISAWGGGQAIEDLHTGKCEDFRIYPKKLIQLAQLLVKQF